MITYLPDGREVAVTQAADHGAPVFKAVFSCDPGGISGYGASADAAVDSLLSAVSRDRHLRAVMRWAQARLEGPEDPGRCQYCGYPARMTDHIVVHHADGDPSGSAPGTLVLVDARENFQAEHINAVRLDNRR